MSVPIFDGSEPFEFNSDKLPYSIREFWAWNNSNLLSNTLRGALAEFIVAKALGIKFDTARDDWTAYDLTYQFGGRSVPVEVKSSAYLQAWPQVKLSDIRFDIAQSREWMDQKLIDPLRRHADIYVFCLFAFRDMENKFDAKPMQLEQWDFFVLPTAKLDTELKAQRSVSLTGLLALSPIRCAYNDIKESVDIILSQNP